MLHKVSSCLLILVFVCASPLVAQTVKKDEKKESKPAAVNQAKDVKKPSAPRTMKFVSCSQSGCGFWAKSHSAKELRIIMKRHARVYHKTALAYKQLKEMVKKHEAK